MIRDIGTVRPGTTIYVPFETYDSNDPSASVTITGLATTDIEIYKDGSTTQRASDSGYALLDTDGIDFDSTTGIHGVSIDLSDNTTAGFWAAGSQYFVVIASITVDAATINFIPVTFTIGYPDAVINTTIATLSSQTSFTLTSGPAENDALNGCVCCIHDVASAVQLGFAVISDYVGSTKTVTLQAGTTYTAAATDNIAIYPPTNVNAWATIALATTNPLPNAAAGAAGGLPTDSTGKTSFNDVSAADVNAQCDTALADYDAVVPADLPSNFADLSITATTGRVDVAAIAGTAQTANDNGADINAILTDTADMQPKLGTITDLGSGATVGDNLSDMAGATFSSATDSQEAIRDRGDAAWTTGAGGSPPTTLQNTTIATLSSQTSFTLTAGSADNDAYNNMLAIVTDSATSTQKAVGVVSDYVGSTKTVTLREDPAVFTMAAGDTIDIVATTPDAANILLDTAEIGTAGAGLTNINLPDQTMNITGNLSGSVGSVTGAVGSVTGAVGSVTGNVGGNVTGSVGSISGITFPTNFSDLSISVTTGLVSLAADQSGVTIGTVTTNTDMRGTDSAFLAANAPTNFADLSITATTGRVDVAAVAGTSQTANDNGSDINAIKVVTDALTASAAATLALHAAGIITGSTSGTPTTTSSNTDLTGYADNELIGRVIIFTGGTANGQASDITDYANTNGVVTYTALTTAPAASDSFIIV